MALPPIKHLTTYHVGSGLSWDNVNNRLISTGGTIYTFSSGLGDDGAGLIRLGGNLSRNTLINGLETHNMIFQDTALFQVVSVGNITFNAMGVIELTTPTISIPNLSGADTRMMVITSGGTLSTQAIPSGGGSSYQFTNGLTESGGVVKFGGTVTGSTEVLLGNNALLIGKNNTNNYLKFNYNTTNNTGFEFKSAASTYSNTMQMHEQQMNIVVNDTALNSSGTLSVNGNAEWFIRSDYGTQGADFFKRSELYVVASAGIPRVWLASTQTMNSIDSGGYIYVDPQEAGLYYSSGNTSNGVAVTNTYDIIIHNYPNTRNDGTNTQRGKGLYVDANGKIKYGEIYGSISYNELTDKPNIPTNNNQLTNGAGYITGLGVKNGGTLVGTRGVINFVAGSNISYSIADNSTNGDVDVTINSTAGGGVAAWTTVKKSADQVRTATTTLANDAALTLALAANTKYAVRIMVIASSTAAADFKYAITGPAGFTYLVIMKNHILGTASTFATETVYGTATSITTNAAFATVIYIDIAVQNGATAGTLAFQWAQNASDATANATIVRAGSYLEYMTV